MSSHADVAKEFQKRRIQTWKTIKFWCLIMAVGLIGTISSAVFYFCGGAKDKLSWPFILYAIFAGLLLSSLAITIFIARKRYRCPACEKIPMLREGINLDPDRCSNCGVQLKWMLKSAPG